MSTFTTHTHHWTLSQYTHTPRLWAHQPISTAHAPSPVFLLLALRSGVFPVYLTDGLVKTLILLLKVQLQKNKLHTFLGVSDTVQCNSGCKNFKHNVIVNNISSPLPSTPPDLFSYTLPFRYFWPQPVKLSQLFW